MKQSVCVLVFCLCFACKKEQLSTQELIIGKWELRNSSGGWTGTTNYPAGNGQILRFAQTSYFRYHNGQLAESGTYTMMKDTTRNNQLVDRIIFNDSASFIKTFVSVKNNKLSFKTDMVDGGGSQYERIK